MDLVEKTMLEVARKRVAVLNTQLCRKDDELNRAEIAFLEGEPGAGERLRKIDEEMTPISDELWAARADLEELEKCLKKQKRSR